MTSLEKDALLLVLAGIAATSQRREQTFFESFLNEPTGPESRHSEADWFRILKERLNP